MVRVYYRPGPVCQSVNCPKALDFPAEMPHTNYINTQVPMSDVAKSLDLLAEGFKKEFAEVVMQDERFVDALMNISMEFVGDNIPIVDEDIQTEMCLALMDKVGVTTY